MNDDTLLTSWAGMAGIGAASCVDMHEAFIWPILEHFSDEAQAFVGGIDGYSWAYYVLLLHQAVLSDSLAF